MARLPRIAAMLALLAAGGAHAAPFLSIGRNAELLLTGVASVRYDDNIFLSGGATESDVIYSVIPGFEFGYDGGLTQVSVVVNEQFLRYADNDLLDSDLTTATLDLVHQGSDSMLVARAGYRQFSQNTLNALSRDQTARRNLAEASLNAETGLGGRTRIGGGVRYDRTRFPGIGFVGNKSLQFPADLFYALSAKLDVSIGYRYRDNKFQDGLRDSKDQFWNIGARGRFTPKLTGQVRVGLNTRDFDAGDDESQVGTSADLVWFQSPKTTYRLTVANDFTNSALGISQEELTVGLDGRFVFSDTWSAGATLTFSASDFESGRNDDFLVGDFSVVFRPRQNLSFQGAYIHRRNNSNVTSVDFTNNIFSLATSLRY